MATADSWRRRKQVSARDWPPRIERHLIRLGEFRLGRSTYLTDRVLRAWDEHVSHPSLPRTLGPRLRSVGFEKVRMEAHPFCACKFDPETYGAAMLPFMGAFVVGRNGITDEQAQAWVSEQREIGERAEFYFASTQLCFTATKPQS